MKQPYTAYTPSFRRIKLFTSIIVILSLCDYQIRTWHQIVVPLHWIFGRSVMSKVNFFSMTLLNSKYSANIENKTMLIFLLGIWNKSYVLEKKVNIFKKIIYSYPVW